MKKFLRIENWLLIVPVILLIIEKLVIGASTLSLHVSDTYYVFQHSYLSAFLFLFLFIPFLLHLILRISGKRDKIICALHVVVTLILLIFLYRLFYMHFFDSVMPRRYFEFTDFGGHSFSEQEYRYFSYLIFPFLAFQVLFILYFFARLLFAKNPSQ